MGTDQLTNRIIGAAMKVHSALGPGPLESAYGACLYHELRKRDFKSERKSRYLSATTVFSLTLATELICSLKKRSSSQLKAVEKVQPVHSAQLLSHLRLSGHHIGLLINFHVRHLRHGISRVVN
jgi:GxxExxY protein